MIFFNIFNFFAISLEFSIMHRVGTKRNDNFYFLSFSSFSFLFWLEMNPQWYFFNCFVIFKEFSIKHPVRTKRNDNFYFLSSSTLSNLFWLEMAPYWFHDNFLTFFAISLEFSITCRERNGTERNDNTYFLSFS